MALAGWDWKLWFVLWEGSDFYSRAGKEWFSVFNHECVWLSLKFTEQKDNDM